MSAAEHFIELGRPQVASLARWLDHPDRVLHLGRVTLEPVDGGGIVVRTAPSHHPRPRHMPDLADIVAQSLLTVARRSADRVDELAQGNAEDLDQARAEAIVSGRLAEVAGLISDAVHA